MGRGADPFFLRPLWLTTTVRGRRLWAYNSGHLAPLTDFVGADLRERGAHGGCAMSMIEQLPAWLKSSRNRADVLSATARLRAELTDPGRPDPTRRHTAPRTPDLRRYSLYELR